MNVDIGEELPPLKINVSRNLVVRYAGASNDFNPIHHSDRAAKAVGMPGVIAHGMWTMGAGLKIVTDWVKDPSKVISYTARFTKPLVVPDSEEGVTVEVSAKVVNLDADVASVEISAICGEDKLLSAAKVKVRID